MTNRGQLISEYIEREGINKTILAKKILFGEKVRTYRTLLNKLAEPNLSMDDVLSFSKALNHDFFKDMTEFKGKNTPGFNVVNEQQETYYSTGSSDFKEKYYKLLEDQNRLLKQEKIAFETVLTALKELTDFINSKK